jgi:predicted DNA-binding protein YlxM (UPF0122 family)
MSMDEIRSKMPSTMNNTNNATHVNMQTSHEMIEDIEHVLHTHYRDGNCRQECYDDIVSMLRELQEITVG